MKNWVKAVVEACDEADGQITSNECAAVAYSMGFHHSGGGSRIIGMLRANKALHVEVIGWGAKPKSGARPKVYRVTYAT